MDQTVSYDEFQDTPCPSITAPLPSLDIPPHLFSDILSILVGQQCDNLKLLQIHVTSGNNIENFTFFFVGAPKEAVITDITAPGVIFKQRKINNGRFVMC